MEAKITIAEFEKLMQETAPFSRPLDIAVEELGETVTTTMPPNVDNLRPGGTISGPAMMALADTAAYALVLSYVGLVELAVTTSFSVNFLRRPSPGPLRAVAGMLKIGRRLAVVEIDIEGDFDGGPKQVAHVVCTYSLPPDRS